MTPFEKRNEISYHLVHTRGMVPKMILWHVFHKGKFIGTLVREGKAWRSSERPSRLYGLRWVGAFWMMKVAVKL